MIARMWHGKVPAEKADDYHAFLKTSGLSDYAATPGNESVYLLKKQEADVVHFYTLTFWKDLESIKAFAGIDYERAKYYPEDKNYLLEFEEFVEHFEVLEKPAQP